MINRRPEQDMNMNEIQVGNSSFLPIPFSEAKDDSVHSESQEKMHGVLSLSSAVLKKSVYRNGVCKICNKRFRNLQSHMIVHSERRTKDHECKTCGKQYLSRNGLICHQETHSLEKTLKCSKCEKGFTSKLSLNMHIGQMHKTHLCNICGKLLSSSASLARHIRSHSGRKPHVCNICGKGFAYSNVLSDHMLIHAGKKPHICEICGVGFRQKSGMRQHVRYVHNGERNVTCKLCGQSFKRKLHLERHIAVKHENNPSSFGPCHVCGKFYRTAFTLRRHLALHDLPIQCEVCCKGFSTEEKLQRHLKLYSGRKPISCTLCDKRFHIISSAKRHASFHVLQNKQKDEVKEREEQTVQSQPRVKIEIITMQDFNFESENSRKDLNSLDDETENSHVDQSNQFVRDNCIGYKQTVWRNALSTVDILEEDNPDNDDFSLGNSLAEEEQNGADFIQVTVNIGTANLFAPLDSQQTGKNMTRDEVSIEADKHQILTSDGSEYLTNILSNEEITLGKVTELPKQDEISRNYLTNEFKGPDGSSCAKGARSSICETCGKVTSNLTHHQKTHNKTTVKCDKCGKKYLKQSMRYHMKTHEEKKLSCSFCSKQFRTKSSLTQHISVHTKETPFQCEYCPKKFRTKRHLTPHLRTHTGDKPYPCRMCGKRFGYSNARNDHERIHTGEKPYTCHICQASFTQRSSLRSHMVTHTEERPFHCGICEKSFSRKQDLMKHSRIHDEDREMFSCDKCGKTFTGKFNLRQHQIGHSKLSCKSCQARFTSKQELRKHQDRFKGKPPVACGACDRTFHCRASLLKHMKKHTELD